MSRVWMTGLEQDSLDVFTGVSASPTISAVDPRTGTFCLQTPGNSSANNVSVAIDPLRAEVFVRVYAKTVTNTPNAALPWFRLEDSDGVVLFEITETGVVWLGVTGAGVNKGNAGTLTTSYQMYEVQFLVDNAAGSLDVMVDGASVVSDSGIDTRLGAVDIVETFFVGDIIAGTANDSKRFDDIAINNNLGATNNSWCGQGAIVGCVPIANGTTNEFSLFPDTGEDAYENVDELPPNDDTDYNFATAVEQDELYDVTDLESTYGIPRATQVRAIAWWFYNKLVYNGDGEIAGLHSQSGFLQEIPAVACPQIDYDYSLVSIREENSVTAAEFNAGDIDDSEFGFRSKAP